MVSFNHLRMMVTDLLDKLYAFLTIHQVKQRCAKSSKDESFCEHYFDKVMLMNEVTIHQEELVVFIIDGFPDIWLRDQARTHRLYRNISFAESPRNNRDCKEVTNPWISKTLQKEETFTSTRKGPVRATDTPACTREVRCYNCNELKWTNLYATPRTLMWASVTTMPSSLAPYPQRYGATRRPSCSTVPWSEPALGASQS